MALSRIKTNSIADSAITGAKISDGTVVASDIAALSVDSTKLASNAVTNAKLSTNAVSIDKVDSTVTQAFGMRNRIINGDMRIDQRNAGASVTPGNTHTLDRWAGNMNVASKFSVQQNAGGVTPPAGFSKYLGVTSLSSYSTASGDYIALGQSIEGLNLTDLGWGTSNARTITVSFWVRSSLTGTFSFALTNNGYSRGYVSTYTVNSANTWEQKTVTIAGDTTGTWTTDNTAGIRLWFNLGSGSGLNATPNAWGSWVGWGVSGATSVVGTNGATFYLTGVQLEVGASATPFDTRAYGTELALCQRYYQKSYDTNVVPGTANTITGAVANFKAAIDQSFTACRFKVEMRTTPTIVTYNYQGTAGVMAGGSYSTLTATLYQQGTAGFNVVSGTGNPNYDTYVNYTATAEL